MKTTAPVTANPMNGSSMTIPMTRCSFLTISDNGAISSSRRRPVSFDPGQARRQIRLVQRRGILGKQLREAALPADARGRFHLLFTGEEQCRGIACHAHPLAARVRVVVPSIDHAGTRNDH